MRTFALAALLSTLSLVSAQEFIPRNFTSVPCTAANVTTACRSLQEHWGEDVCCANVTVRNGGVTGSVQSTAFQCYPRYHAIHFPNITGNGTTTTLQCVSFGHLEENFYCNSENDCDEEVGECCMEQATLYRGVWHNITTKTCEDKNYTLFAQIDNHFPLDSRAQSTGYFWCNQTTNPKSYAMALGDIYMFGFGAALSAFLMNIFY